MFIDSFIDDKCGDDCNSLLYTSKLGVNFSLLSVKKLFCLMIISYLEVDVPRTNL